MNWPGTQFANNQWSYAPYACNNYWAYSYTINVTAQPSGFGRNTVTKGFLWSTATIANTGADAPIDYAVTMECPQHGSSQVTCSGTLNPGDPSVDCQVGTVAGMFCDVDYVSVIAIRNPDWFAMGYVTGGCVSNLAPGTKCGSASFCCHPTAWPANTTSCGSGDGTTDSPCYDCTGGC